MSRAMASQPLQSLLLKNSRERDDRNMCSLNSNIQLLRHIPEFTSLIASMQNESALLSVLSSIFSQCGRNIPVSASLFRQLLATQVGRPLDSGEQYDTVEILNYLLDIFPNELFHFDTSTQYRFKINGKASSCPTCKQFPREIPGSDKILKIALPNSQSRLSLQALVNESFSPVNQQDGRRCNNCLDTNPNTPLMPSIEKTNLLNHPPYLFMQILRMRYSQGKTEKNCIPIEVQTEIIVDQQCYQIIGIVTHMGTADAGHNRAYLRVQSEWYICEDDKPVNVKIPVDTPFEQCYCLLWKKKDTESMQEVSQSSVAPNLIPLIHCEAPSSLGSHQGLLILGPIDKPEN